jgi:hypothetical protein
MRTQLLISTDSNESQKYYKTDKDVSIITIKRWTLKEYKLYMMFTLTLTFVPLPIEVYNSYCSYKKTYYIPFVMCTIGSFVVLYRIYLISMILWNPKLYMTEERVKYIYNYYLVTFVFFLTLTTFVGINPNEWVNLYGLFPKFLQKGEF